MDLYEPSGYVCTGNAHIHRHTGFQRHGSLVRLFTTPQSARTTHIMWRETKRNKKSKNGLMPIQSIELDSYNIQ